MNDDKIKVLYISSQNPYGDNGGSIGVRRIYLPLMDLNEKNKIELKSIFMCPKKLIPKDIPSNVEIIEIKKYQKYLTKLKGLADYLELYKSKIYDIFCKFKPQVVLIDSSKLGNIVEYMKLKPSAKHAFFIISFGNFELEFAKEVVKYTLPRFLWKFKFKMVEKSESKSVKFSDLCLFLTEKDKESVLKYYNAKKESHILPFYYEDPLTEKISYKSDEKLKIIFTGSLNFSPNIEAALFLIKNAEKIQDIMKTKIQITIAGRNPNQILIESVKNNDLVNIIPNPTKEEMDNILFNSDLFISPVFRGSGIKTKIVEALAHGLPIISSQHSFIGYEFLSGYIDKIIFKFEDENLPDFLSKIELWKDKYKNLKKEDIFNMVRDVYKNFFSFDNLEKEIYSILKSCTKENVK